MAGDDEICLGGLDYGKKQRRTEFGAASSDSIGSEAFILHRRIELGGV
jgi:hypothetical protein